ncbi:Uncharacterised protein [Photobacterium damselae]|uniref:Uncharacterized protein n=1 Tax=Photobacterium damselae TaxID=38293 RepID=A0A2X1XQ30_PHODM|nr:Uncharacterised protein [Photobacterium damselae]SPY45250.1 Uncharacterised protein [Photobacterium damselae]
MTSISVSTYSDLNNVLRSIPKNQLHAYCRENGFHSHFNAKSSAYYQPMACAPSTLNKIDEWCRQ